jgi:valyl-tRNA synthetase
VTEELWGHLKRAAQAHSDALAPKGGWEEALIIARWPEAQSVEGWEEQKVADFNLVQDVVRAIRNLRAEKNLPPSKKLAATLVGGAKTDLLTEQSRVIASLAGLDHSQLTILSSLDSKPEGTAALVVGAVEIYIPLAGAVDSAEERSRLEKELKEAESHIERLEKLLSSDFANKAPAPVVAKEREKLAGYKETAEKIKSQL